MTISIKTITYYFIIYWFKALIKFVINFLWRRLIKLYM